MIEFLAPGIATVIGVIPDIDKLITDLEYNVSTGVIQWIEAEVSGGENEVGKRPNIRDTSIIGVGFPTNETQPPADGSAPINHLMYNLGKTLQDAFHPHIEEYCRKFGMGIREYDGYQLLKYGKGQKFDRHTDDHPDFPRRISLTYYANDDYEGGEIEFDEFNLTIKPVKNQLLLFPSAYVYTHAVHPVISGTRYAVVQWMR